MLTIVMPAHNEEQYLRASVDRVVRELRERRESFEVIVCENGSVDDTLIVADSLADRHAEVRVTSSTEADYGRALRSGFLLASGDLIINFDVDFVDLGFTDRALALARRPDGPSLIIGSKRCQGSDDQRAWGRKVVTGIFWVVLHLGFGLRVSDTHGLKLLRRDSLAPFVDACRFGADIFDTELVLRAERAGLQVREIPVDVIETRPPRSSISRRIPRTLLGLGRLRLALWSDRRGRSTQLIAGLRPRSVESTRAS